MLFNVYSDTGEPPDESNYLLTATLQIIGRIFRLHPEALISLQHDLEINGRTKYYFNDKQPAVGIAQASGIIICAAR